MTDRQQLEWCRADLGGWRCLANPKRRIQGRKTTLGVASSRDGYSCKDADDWGRTGEQEFV